MNTKKRILVHLSANLCLFLIVLSGYSMVSLFLLFTIFFSIIGVFGRICYLAVNDNLPKNQRMSLMDLTFEEVSMNSVLAILSAGMQVYLSMCDKWAQLISLEDPGQSLLAFGVVHVFTAWVWLFEVKMWTFIWLFYLTVLAAPFVYPKIKPQMDGYAQRLHLGKKVKTE